ncbi:MAG: DUF814 domain-containing protein [Bacteroidetes bacterium]|nr:DUF814 domain-containing protein [Bacteroidota bacterium]
MYKNYFFLNREIVELNRNYTDYNIVSIFSQYKNLLLIECQKNGHQIFIEISTNPGDPYFHLRENFSRARKNTIDVFGEIPAAIILSFEIAEYDRVIKIQTDKYSLYYPIRGKYTNVYFIYNELTKTFKKTENEVIASFKDEILKLKFISSFHTLNFIDENDGSELSSFRSKYPIVNKDILLEYKSRIKNDFDFLDAEILKEILNEINNKEIVCFVEENLMSVKLSVNTFKSVPFTVIKTFDNYQAALSFLISKKNYFDRLTKVKKVIEKYLSKELQFITSKLNRLKIILEEGEQSERFNKIATLLLININSIKKGMKEISLKDIETEEIKNIKLNEKFLPKDNIDYYFRKTRGERIKFEKAEKDFEAANIRFNYLRRIEKDFNATNELDKLENIAELLKLNTKEKIKMKEDITSKFRTYIIDNKYYVYVGKDGKSNDLLTTKFAKQNDIWFHVRGLPGSHVVLKITDTKTKPPKSIIKIAAIVAAFHSKGKTAGLVPVSYAQKKYVIKKKGMAPGKVIMLKEETVLVRPQIPKNCVFISSQDK